MCTCVIMHLRMFRNERLCHYCLNYLPKIHGRMSRSMAFGGVPTAREPCRRSLHRELGRCQSRQIRSVYPALDNDGTYVLRQCNYVGRSSYCLVVTSEAKTHVVKLCNRFLPCRIGSDGDDWNCDDRDSDGLLESERYD